MGMGLVDRECVVGMKHGDGEVVGVDGAGLVGAADGKWELEFNGRVLVV